MAQHTIAEDKITTYRRRDSAKLAYDVRSLLEEHDRVEVWSDEEQLLADAEGDEWVHEIEDGNRGVLVDREQVRPEDVVELIAYDELHDSEQTGGRSR